MQIRSSRIAALGERCAHVLFELPSRMLHEALAPPRHGRLLRRAAGAALRMPGACPLLRAYVRYAHAALVPAPAIERADAELSRRGRPFRARTVFGAVVSGNTRDFIQRYLYLFGIWEPNLTQWLGGCLRRGDTFVDVGANIGYFSLLAAKLVGPGGRVVAIEASPGIFAALARHVEHNGADNVRLMQCAVADTRGRLRLYRAPEWNLGATSLYCEPGFVEEGEVDAAPLSELLTRAEAERARVIKIDVEGAEAAAVRGLLPLLPSLRDDAELVVEVGGGPRGARGPDTARAVIGMLCGHGFNVYRLENDYAPTAYRAGGACARPRRVRDGGSVTGECDLVFSRRDAPAL